MAFKHFWVQYRLGQVSDQAYVTAESFVIGRAPDCDLPIPTDILSRRHLKVILEDQQIFIQDLGSTNGSFLQGQRLEVGKKYEYKTGNRLYLDAGKECSLRITAIFQRDIADLEIERKGLELEKKKHELRGKGRIGRSLKDLEVQENFLASVPSSVDNIFENLIYIAKSARFNKEKQIKEAEHISQEMIEKAQKEMATQRALLEKELKDLQIKTKKEANRTLKSANEKANEHIKKADHKVRRLVEEAKSGKKRILAEAEDKRQKLIESAQERYAEIIAEAHIKNKELLEENDKIDSLLIERRNNLLSIEAEIESLQLSAKEHESLTQKIKDTYTAELSHLNELKEEVLNLEKRNAAALDVFEEKIPGLEKEVAGLEREVAGLEKKIFNRNVLIKKKETEVEEHESKIEDLKQEIDKFEEKSSISEKRLDDLNARITEAEDNLLRLNKIKQQRNEEIDREIAERRKKQERSEEKTAEKIARRKERAEKEIAVNIANAKEQARTILADATTEQERVINEAKAEADRFLAQAKLDLADEKRRVEEDLKAAKDESMALRAEAREYHSEQTKAADDYAHRVREEADIDVISRRKTLELEIQESKDKLLADIRKEAKEMQVQAETEAEKIIATANERAESLISRNQSEMENQLNDLQKEIARKKQETDEEIHSLRAHAVQKMEEQKKRMEQDEEERNRLRVLKLRKDLNEVLRARIIPFLKDDNQVEKISQVMAKSINAILLDEVEGEIFDAENYSDIDPTLQQNKVKKFYIAFGMATVMVILLFVFAPFLEKMTKEKGRSLAQQIEKENKEKMEAIKRANDFSAVFAPDLTEEYLPTYTERVMYMKDYLRLETNEVFKGQWHLELEEFFVDELHLTETDMVPFVSREAALLKELAEARQVINGNFVDEGRQRLKEIEANFFKRIKQNGLTQQQINKILKFKQQFFEENKALF